MTAFSLHHCIPPSSRYSTLLTAESKHVATVGGFKPVIKHWTNHNVSRSGPRPHRWKSLSAPPIGCHISGPAFLEESSHSSHSHN